MVQCANCLLDLTQYVPVANSHCPNCGYAEELKTEPSSGVAGRTPFSLLKNFWFSVKEVIFQPTLFFTKNRSLLTSHGGLSTALTFAVIVQWVASFFNFIWRISAGAYVSTRISDLLRITGDVFQVPQSQLVSGNLDELRQKIMDFLFGAGAIVLTPFTTILKLVFIAALVHIAVRFFIKEKEGRQHRYSTTVKVLSYASAPWLLCIIPGFGIILAYILAFCASVIGIRETFETSNSRATLVVLFPEILFLMFFLTLVVILLFIAFNVLNLVF